MNAPIEGFALTSLANMEAEQSILGGLMLDNSLWDSVGDLLIAADFFREEHQQIFTAIGSLINANKAADIITVHDLMGGTTTLLTLDELAQFVPSANNVRRYAQIVRDRSLSRKLLAASSEIGEIAMQHTAPFAERLEQATGQLIKLMPDTATEDWVGLDQTIVSLLDRISERADGSDQEDVIPTGLADLDEMMDGGMRPGQLIIVGARPSMGKSALAVTIGMNVAEQQGLPVGMFSLEMPKEELAMRQVSMMSHIHLTRIRRSERLNNHDWPRLTAAVDTLRTLSFHVSEHGGPNINQLRSRARKLKRKHGLKLLIVDYLQLATGTNTKDSRNNQLGEVSRGLKSLAKELGVPIIALAQLGRDIEKRTNPRPMMSDLKDCGDIEQDADVILFIDRPIVNNPSLGNGWEQYAEIIVGKQRNGPRGSVNSRYVGENVQFLNWDGDKPTRIGRSSGGDL